MDYISRRPPISPLRTGPCFPPTRLPERILIYININVLYLLGPLLGCRSLDPKLGQKHIRGTLTLDPTDGGLRYLFRMAQEPDLVPYTDQVKVALWVVSNCHIMAYDKSRAIKLVL